MIDPILTICIQTFNRSNYIEYLLSQLPDCGSFKILVGDYSSEEYHSDLTRSLCCQRSHTVYYHSEDKGLDHGFCELIERATTKYCWLMPDDDVILKEYLPQVLSILDSSNPSLLLLNSSVNTEQLKKEIKRESFRQKPLLKEISHGNLSDVEHILSYVGSCIFNRRLWLNYIDPKNVGTYFNHVYVAGQLLHNGHKFLALNLVCIRIRANNALWTARSFKIWTENWPAALSFLRSDGMPIMEKVPTSTLLYYYAYGAINSKNNPQVFRSSKVLMFFDVVGKNISSMIVYILISMKCFTLVSEPGYYLLKANKNKFSRFLLRVFYDD